MNTRISELAEQIRRLETELTAEIQRIRIRTYEIRDRGIHFSAEIRRRLLPALLLDLTVTLFQSICFPLYGIPKVRPADHIVVDRHHLAYIGEVAARTEQYWCPIKHAAQLQRAQPLRTLRRIR